MERVYGNMKIKSNWFDSKKKNRKIAAIGYKGLNLYLSLGKYRLVRLTNNIEFRIHVTISTLRKETGYSSKEIIELLKILINQKIIRLIKPTRWDRLYDADGKLKSNEQLVILATDVPVTTRVTSDDGKIEDQIKSDEDYYISVDLDMLEYYKTVGLDERYFPLYCLLRKLSNGTEGKAFMTIHNMAETLSMHHDTIHKYIKILNKMQLLCSDKTKNKKDGFMFEHRLCGSVSQYNEFQYAHKNTMMRNTKRWKLDCDIEKIMESNIEELELYYGESDLEETTSSESVEYEQSFENCDGEYEIV
ncbi:hypothetical protein MNQ98_04380 [Paenibacillus sp. N3/727]|uniref:hypothetical protein n=1 Tax=Paenibacillus sp. N3/727 TaxID=2925845 RepID=UPI001F52E587|nr:hypothetical protein [Paenibacillus sp. N3/727]UNK19281.1 hypothetical protein MNQ98_04380 [Paenibacillus sp. N3/727]